MNNPISDIDRWLAFAQPCAICGTVTVERVGSQVVCRPCQLLRGDE